MDVRLTKTLVRALDHMVACGHSTAEDCGVSERTMRRLVSMRLAYEAPAGRVRTSLSPEYGITMAGREAVKFASQ